MTEFESNDKTLVTEAPGFCQYADGACLEEFGTTPSADALFLYPSQPKTISLVIERAVQDLKRERPDGTYVTWKELPISGNVIFCEICKQCRRSKNIVVDVTTLNFNLLFEIGFGCGSFQSTLLTTLRFGLRVGIMTGATFPSA